MLGISAVTWKAWRVKIESMQCSTVRVAIILTERAEEPIHGRDVLGFFHGA